MRTARTLQDQELMSESKNLLAERRELGNNLSERRVESTWLGKATGRDSVNATVSNVYGLFGRDSHLANKIQLSSTLIDGPDLGRNFLFCPKSFLQDRSRGPWFAQGVNPLFAIEWLHPLDWRLACLTLRNHCPEWVWSLRMRLPFCILNVLGDVLDDGELHFVEAARTLEAATLRVKALAGLCPGQYIIYDEQTGERVSIIAGAESRTLPLEARFGKNTHRVV